MCYNYKKFRYFYPIKNYILDNIYDNIINFSLYSIYYTLKDLMYNIEDEYLIKNLEKFFNYYENNNLYYLMIYNLKKFKWFSYIFFEEDAYYFFYKNKIYQIKLNKINLSNFIGKEFIEGIEIKNEEWINSFFSFPFDESKNFKLKNFLFNQYKDNDALVDDCETILNNIEL